MLKKNLIDRLKNAKSGKIKVVWNTGGDETIVNFYDGDKPMPYFDDSLLDNLRDYLIQEFDLPNAGEYYNDGSGVISLVEETRILFVYDEFAYGENYEDELVDSEELEEFIIPTNLPAQNLLAKLNLTKVDFHGSICFFRKETDEFEISSQTIDYRKSKEKVESIQKYIKEQVLTKFTPPFEAMEIGYAGIINEEEIVIEELYKIKYFIDKNKKQEKIFLFEKGGPFSFYSGN